MLGKFHIVSMFGSHVADELVLPCAVVGRANSLNHLRAAAGACVCALQPRHNTGRVVDMTAPHQLGP
jgi:hypothetical protein